MVIFYKTGFANRTTSGPMIVSRIRRNCLRSAFQSAFQSVTRYARTAALLVVATGALACNTTTNRVAPPPTKDAGDAIVEALQSAQVVAIGERHGHREMYQFLDRLLRMPPVQDAVDDIVVEFGNAFYQPVIDRYIRGDDVPFDSVRLAWRNAVVSPNTVWDSPVYGDFYHTVREINQSLPADRQYRLLAGDVSIDWNRIGDREDIAPFFRSFRSEHMFGVLRNEVLGKKRKALFIAGGAHTSRRNMTRTRDTGLNWAEVSAGSLLELYYPGSLFVVGTVARSDDIDLSLLADVVPGTLIPVAGTWLGELEANAITNMRNYDGTPFTLFGDATLADMVDAILYWGPPGSVEYENPDPAIYRDERYWKELNRRSQILRGQPMDPSVRDGN